MRHGQTKQSIERFWAPVLISALNDDLDKVSVRYAALVFRDSFLKSAEAGRMGLPAVPLSDLYGVAASYIESRGGHVHLRSSVEGIRDSGDGVKISVGGETTEANYAILATPFNIVEKLLPDTLAMHPCANKPRTSRRFRSPAFIYGSIARSLLSNTLCCWSAPFSGCSRSRKSSTPVASR